jgi:arginine decarboxylase
MADQTEAPYLDAVVSYVARNPGRFHIPGHKGTGSDPGLIAALGEAAVLHDVPPSIEGIDVGREPTPFQRAQRLAAAAWGARRSWFLVNGASGGNHAICMSLAHARGELATGPPDRGRVVVQRNVHSTIDGLVLSGLRPTFVAPEIDRELGIAHCVTPEALDAALEAEPNAVAAMLVSPTYFGAVARIDELADVAHARHVPLVVDEAWGAHLYFHDSLPTGALRGGADLVLSSTHKIVGSLTQSAILHLGDGGRVDEDVIDRSVTLVESTSPNALLTASLDAARRFAATRGEELLSETLSTLARTREQIREIPGLNVLDERLAGRNSVAAWDPLRLSVDVRGTGATGHRIAQLMREHDDIILELFSENVIVAVFGIGETPTAPAERLVDGLRHAVEEIGPGDLERRRAFAEPPPWGPLELAPRDAFLGAQEVVAFEQAESRIAAESLAAYPPGVPNVLPGERLTGPTLDYIADSLAHGGLVRGASDRSLRTIRVVRE